MDANIPSKILLQHEGKLRTKFHGEKISLKERTDVIFTGHWAFLLFSFFLLFFFCLFFVLCSFFLFFVLLFHNWDFSRKCENRVIRGARKLLIS